MLAWHLAQASFPGMLDETEIFSAAEAPLVVDEACGAVCAQVGPLLRKLQNKSEMASQRMVWCFCLSRGSWRALLQVAAVSDTGEFAGGRNAPRFNRAEVIG